MTGAELERLLAEQADTPGRAGDQSLPGRPGSGSPSGGVLHRADPGGQTGEIRRIASAGGMPPLGWSAPGAAGTGGGPGGAGGADGGSAIAGGGPGCAASSPGARHRDRGAPRATAGRRRSVRGRLGRPSFQSLGVTGSL